MSGAERVIGTYNSYLRYVTQPTWQARLVQHVVVNWDNFLHRVSAHKEWKVLVRVRLERGDYFKLLSQGNFLKLQASQEYLAAISLSVSLLDVWTGKAWILRMKGVVSLYFIPIQISSQPLSINPDKDGRPRCWSMLGSPAHEQLTVWLHTPVQMVTWPGYVDPLLSCTHCMDMLQACRECGDGDRCAE